MALRVADRVMEASTVTGTGAATLTGVYTTGYIRFNAIPSIAISDTLYYLIEAVDANGNATGEWEAGLGTYSSANTLTRTTVQASSTGSAVSFSAGNKRVMLDATAGYLASLSSTSGTVTSQTGTAYTAVLGDANSYIQFSNAAAIAFTIPQNSSVAFPVGTVIEMEQAGAGALSVVAGTGTTINSRGADLTLAGQYAVAFLKKVATNTWTLNGDL